MGFQDQHCRVEKFLVTYANIGGGPGHGNDLEVAGLPGGAFILGLHISVVQPINDISSGSPHLTVWDSNRGSGNPYFSGEVGGAGFGFGSYWTVPNPGDNGGIQPMFGPVYASGSANKIDYTAGSIFANLGASDMIGTPTEGVIAVVLTYALMDDLD